MFNVWTLKESFICEGLRDLENWIDSNEKKLMGQFVKVRWYFSRHTFVERNKILSSRSFLSDKKEVLDFFKNISGVTP